MERRAQPDDVSATAVVSRERPVLPVLLAALVGIMAFVWFDRLNPRVFPINDDPIRDQLMARDCVELNACHLLGARSSFGDLFHGAVWIDLLAAVRLAGGGLPAQRVMVLAALALSVATLFMVVWRWLRPAMALPAALLLSASLSVEPPAALLINPSMAVFPDLLTAAALLCFGLSRQLRFLLAAGFALGVAVSMHTASLGLVAPFLAVVAMARPGAWRDLLVGGVIAGITYALPSSAALRANMLALAEHGLLTPMLVAGLAWVALAMVCGAQFRRCTWNTRAWIIAAALVIPFAVILFWFMQRHVFSSIYLHPILAPLAVSIAALVTIPFEWLSRWAAPLRWLPTLAVVVGAVVGASEHARVAAPVSPEPRTWTIDETAVIADEAARRGWSYGDLTLHLQGSACRELLAGVAMFAPAPRSAPRATDRHLQVVKAPRAAFASQDGLIDMAPNAVLLREIDSWLRPGALKSCRLPAAGGAPLCGTVIPVMPDADDPQRFLFLHRTFFLIDNLDALQRPYVATYEIPLVPIAGDRRVLTLTDADAGPCGWRITRVEGVRIEGPLPARQVRMHANDNGRGRVVFEKSFGAAGCPNDIDSRYPPCVLETTVDDPLWKIVEPS